ncbi:MAG: ATP-grasp domain-containing protein [Propionibacteriales bacterium]|nr:ATP-grasp domain-containing protein [Propionibacteriales bacterium]
MNVVFVEPSFPHNQREFVRGLAAVGARVFGIGERPYEWLDEELKGWLTDYVQIGSVTDTPVLRQAVELVQSRVWVDLLEATIESHTLPTAEVREACGIPGTSRRTAWLCRDKPSMKQTLSAAGIPTAATVAATTSEEITDFVARIGYPVIIKPRSGAGAQGTTKINNDTELAAAIAALADDQVAVEEFVDGHEGFYDTLSIDGTAAHDFVCHYYPNVLEAMRTRWISPQFISTNEVDAVGAYAQVKELGHRVNEVLGIGTSATHLEWFIGDRGLRFSEVGCRPSGVGAWDLYAHGNEMDPYRAWAQAVVHGSSDQLTSRRFAAGMIALRPGSDGVITRYDGVDEIWDRYGEWIIDDHFPPPGTPTQPVEAGYMANAWMRLKHPSYETMRAMLDDVGRSVTVHAA